MPEGPEIRRAADQVAKAIVAQPLTQVFFAFERLKPFEAALADATVVAVEPRGKALLTRFDNQLNVYSHNQLYGKWIVRRAGSLPKTNRQLRFAVFTERRSALLYSASDIDVLHDDALSAHPFLSRIGPDVLDQRTTVDGVVERLQDKAFRRRRLGTLLLDQSFLSGLGNYLRTEILFVAGVHPTLRPIDCSDAQLAALAEASVALSRRSYETGGITNDLDRAAELKAAGVKRSRYRHHAFARAGQPCYRCGAKIEKAQAAGRRYYHCARCQPAP